MNLMKPNAILWGRERHLLGPIQRVHRLMALWIVPPMFGSGATTGLQRTTTTMPRLAIPKVLIAVTIT